MAGAPLNEHHPFHLAGLAGPGCEAGQGGGLAAAAVRRAGVGHRGDQDAGDGGPDAGRGEARSSFVSR